MAEHILDDGLYFVAPLADFKENEMLLVDVVGEEIGVVLHQNQLYAYRNYCLHQGGPICYGEILGKQEAILDEEKRLIGERFSEGTFHLVCPWHGWEYEIRTGECVTNRKIRLHSYEVVVQDGNVYLRGVHDGKQQQTGS